MPLRALLYSWLVIALHSACLAAPSDEADGIESMYDPCAGILLQAAADTTSVEQASIRSAIDLWNQVGTFDVDTIPKRDDAQTLDIRFEDAALLFRGVYKDGEGVLIINRRLTDPTHRELVVAHELGHALGLPHIEDRHSVMNSGNLEIPPQLADVDALGQLWGPCVQHQGEDVVTAH